MKEFNIFTGLQHVLTPTWTFWNSMFLAGFLKEKKFFKK